mgnify:CR=1 FL=1
MPGYQFIHVAQYGRRPSKRVTTTDKRGITQSRGGRWTMQEVADEALRDTSATPHVETPAAPTYGRGAGLRGWIDAIAALADAAKDSRGHKLRADRNLIVAGVASFPVPVRDLVNGANDGGLRRWIARTVAHLEREFASLGPVLLHVDESHPHLHFYAGPVATQHAFGFGLGAPHPGDVARAAAQGGESSAEAKKRGNEAYRRALRKFQDRYFENVGLPCGQARLGPRRRRLDRHEWKVEQVTAELAEACIARREDRHRKEMAGVRAQASEAMRRAQALPRVSVSGIKPVSGWAADESAQEQAEVVNSRTREVIKRLKP